MTVGFTVSVDFTGIVENEPEEVSEYTYGAPEFVPGPVLPEVVEPAVSRVQAPPLDPVSARSKIVSRSAMLSSRVGLDQPIGSGSTGAAATVITKVSVSVSPRPVTVYVTMLERLSSACRTTRVAVPRQARRHTGKP